jgi:GntR family transcriptional repressor for pyruvate dehydrogenase complex
MTMELERSTLAEQIGRQLMNLINEQQLKPGDAFPSEIALTEMFSVSRSVVREALVQLKSLGIVSVRSGRPPVVREIDNRLPSIFFEYSILLKNVKAHELLEVRRGLEMQSALLAARHATDEEIASMQDTTVVMEAALQKRGYDQFVELDVKFHLQVASSSRNKMLLQLVEAIREPVRDSIRVGVKSRKTEQEIQLLHDDHRRIVLAIAAHDEPAASEAMALHFDGAISAIMAAKEEDKQSMMP